MRKAALSFGTLVLFFFVGLSPAEAGDCTIFVSTGTGGQILCIEQTPIKVRPILHKSTDFAPQDIEICGNDKIYVFNTARGQILEVNQNGTSEQIVYDFFTSPLASKPAQPNGGSCLGFDLYFNASGGVWRLPGIADPTRTSLPDPEKVVNIPGMVPEGNAFAMSGELLIVDRGSGGRVFKAGPPFPATSTSATNLNFAGLSNPVGVAVSAPFKDTLNVDSNQIFVANHGNRTIRRCGFNGSCSNLTSFTAPEGPLHIDFNLAGDLIVVTADDLLGTNAKVYRVNPQTGAKTLIVEIERNGGNGSKHVLTDRAIGVAVPASATSSTQSVTAGASQFFKCGSSKVEITPTQTCSATVACKEITREACEDLIAPPFFGQCVSPDWNDGFSLLWDINGTGCGDIDFYIAYQNAAESADPSGDPKVIQVSPAPTQDVTTGYYLDGGAFPNDPGTDGRIKGTELVRANLELEQEGVFGGFDPHLGEFVGDPATRTFNQGQTVPIRFSLFGVSPPVEAFLSVSRIRNANGTDTFVRIEPESSGGSNEGDQFRCDEIISGGVRCVYNLSTSFAIYTPGLYAITVRSDSMDPERGFFFLK